MSPSPRPSSPVKVPGVALDGPQAPKEDLSPGAVVVKLFESECVQDQGQLGGKEGITKQEQKKGKSIFQTEWF